MENKNKGLRAKEGRIKLYVDHEGKDLTFIYPTKSPGTFAQVGKEIDSDGLVRPTMAQTASLAYAAWQNPEDKYSKKVIGIIKHGWLWAFNGILWTPNNGVYVQDNPKTENGWVSMNRSELEKKLKKGDPSVRHVDYGFKLGEQSALNLEKNPFVQALAGKEGAEKLAHIANQYRNKPVVYGLKEVNEDIQVAVLRSNWDLLDGRLFVSGGSNDDDWVRAFGIIKEE